ncbi:MAG: hypothetical protein NVSMB64_14410 [Candidatus Velthaea sp.]
MGVIAQNIYCVSRSTVLSVAVEPKHSVTVDVDEGSVDVKRGVAIRLVAEGVAIDGLRESSIVTAGHVATYAIPSVPHAFPNVTEANSYYTGQLQAALAADDRAGIEDATFDLQRIAQFVPVLSKVPKRTSHFPWIPVVIATSVVIFVTTHPGNPSQPPLQPPLQKVTLGPQCLPLQPIASRVR